MKKQELGLLLEQWKTIVSGKEIVLEEVLNMMLKENNLSKSSGFKSKIGTILASLFILSPNTSSADVGGFENLASRTGGIICNDTTCTVKISPKSALSKLQQSIQALGINLDISDIDGMSESDGLKFIKSKILENKDVIMSFLRSEDAMVLAGIEDENKSGEKPEAELFKLYSKAPGYEMFKPVIELLKGQ